MRLEGPKRGIPRSPGTKEPAGDRLAWHSQQEPEPSGLVKGLQLHPRQERKLLKGSVHKNDLSYRFL